MEHITQYKDLITKLAAAYFPNSADKEDAIQEAYVKFMFVDLSAVENRYSWMYSAVQNLFRDLYSKANKMRDLDQHASIEEAIDDNDPLYCAIKEEEETGLSRSIDDLSDELSIVASMYYLDGMSYKDIAHCLGIPEGTVASRMNTVRKYLARGIYEDTSQV